MTKKNEKVYSILIVDDDFFLLDMYALKFTHSDFAVETASSGAEAIEKIKGGTNPDVILLDAVMPELDGFEFLESLTKEKLAQDSLVVFLSNLSQESDIEKAKKLHAVDYIVKAKYTPSEVVTKVLDIIHKHDK